MLASLPSAEGATGACNRHDLPSAKFPLSLRFSLQNFVLTDELTNPVARAFLAFAATTQFPNQRRVIYRS